jgi:hypothetical protein
LPDRGDATIDAIRGIRQHNMEQLRAVTIAAIHEALHRTGNEPPAADVNEPGTPSP